MTGREWFVAFAGLVVGVLLGRVWEIQRRLNASKKKARRDEASRFDVGDTITLSDGSRLVVAKSLPPEGSGDE